MGFQTFIIGVIKTIGTGFLAKAGSNSYDQLLPKKGEECPRCGTLITKLACPSCDTELIHSITKEEENLFYTIALILVTVIFVSLHFHFNQNVIISSIPAVLSIPIVVNLEQKYKKFCEANPRYKYKSEIYWVKQPKPRKRKR